ncbi:MAG: hypothetical protein WDO12_05695 [Pseudomonadota bacterium]
MLSENTDTGWNCSINRKPHTAAVITRSVATRAGVFVSRSAKNADW